MAAAVQMHCVRDTLPTYPSIRNVEWFDWDDGNVAELAAHDVTGAEAEQVIRDDADAEVLRNERAAAGRWFVIGRTRGGRQLRLSVLWAHEDERVLRVITGWDEP